MRASLLIAMICAALMTAPVNAEGLTGCCKKPLRAEGLHHLKKPL